MYVKNIDIYSVVKPGKQVLITEFFPKVSGAGGNYIAPAIPMFNHLANNGVILTNNVQRINPLTKEHYIEILRKFVNDLSNANQVTVFSSKDENVMYDDYCIILNSGFVVTGLSNIVVVDHNSYAVVNHTIDYTPPEGAIQPVTLDSYITSLRCMISNLVVDLSTAIKMYQKYIRNFDINMKRINYTVFNNIVANGGSIAAAIDNLLLSSNPTVELLEDVLINERYSQQLLPYYDIMHSQFGLTETMAKCFLPYSSLLINRTINKARSLGGIETDRVVIMNGVSITDNQPVSIKLL